MEMVKKVLVSQPRPAVIEKSPFNEVMTKYNVEVDFKPLIKVVGVSLKEFRSQRIEILDHTAVIFTSRTTVDSFFKVCEEARITVPETMKYICNTEAVALYLQKYIVYLKTLFERKDYPVGVSAGGILFCLIAGVGVDIHLV